MYNRTIIIQFYFPLENLDQSIHFEASVTLYPDFCLVYGFKTLDDNHMENMLSNGSEMPRMIIQPVEEDGRLVYVHKDSQKKTQMSEIIGQAIEETLRGEMAGDLAKKRRDFTAPPNNS